jgi:molybdopterin synthase catalytic subunit
MTKDVTIRVLFFGLVKEITGCAEENLEAPEGLTAGGLYDLYTGRFPALAGLRNSVLVAVNQEFVARAHVLSAGDEAALLPPVSGGADGSENWFGLTREPIDTRTLAARVVRGSDGAVCTFHGSTRDNTKGRRTLSLDYECYEAMALKVLTELGEEIAARHGVRIAIQHRLGALQIGEVSVVIVVASPHRKAAFRACEEAIDTLKQRVPIWKKELFEDGEVWVEGQWDESLRSL